MNPLLQALRRTRAAREPDPSEPRVRIARSVASHLLAYPDQELLARLPLLRSGIERADDGAEPGPATMLPMLARLEEAASDGSALRVLQQIYVETFDQRRRGSMYLSYFTHGDTRRRGMALLGIKQQMQEAGFEVSDDELPDHLAVILEFAGTADAERGEKILRTYRPGLELLRRHLTDIGSPWSGVLIAVSATLPPLGEDEAAAVLKLITEGPAEEEVGLAGYGADAGPPASAPIAWDQDPGSPWEPIDADAEPAGGPVALPLPTLRPASLEGDRRHV